MVHSMADFLTRDSLWCGWSLLHHKLRISRAACPPLSLVREAV
jgi:hypothetical protein